MRCRFDVIFLTLIAPRRLKISRYTRNSILKIVFTMVGRPKMPREVRNGRFLQIAPIWTVTAKLREMASVKIWKNAVFRFGGSPRSFWHTSCSGLFLRESRLPKKCTVKTWGSTPTSPHFPACCFHFARVLGDAGEAEPASFCGRHQRDPPRLRPHRYSWTGVVTDTFLWLLSLFFSFHNQVLRLPSKSYKTAFQS